MMVKMLGAAIAARLFGFVQSLFGWCRERKHTRIFGLAATLLALTSASSAASTVTITVSSYVDAEDYLHISGNTLQWETIGFYYTSGFAAF